MNPTRARLRFAARLVDGTRRDLARLNGLDPARLALVTAERAFAIFARYCREAVETGASEEPDFAEAETAAAFGDDYKKVAGWLTYGQFMWAANRTRFDVAKLLLPDATVVRNDSLPETVLNNG